MTNWERLRAVHDNLVFDLPPDITLTDAETDIIETALTNSRWLRANIRSLFRLYKWLPKLEAGYYDDYNDYFQTNEEWTQKAPTLGRSSRYAEEHITPQDINNRFTIITGDDAEKE